MEEELKKEVEEVKQIALDNQQAIQKHTEDIKQSFEKIEQNTFVLDIIKDYKQEIDTLKGVVKTNQRIIKIMSSVLIIMVILLAFVCIHHFIIA